MPIQHAIWEVGDKPEIPKTGMTKAIQSLRKTNWHAANKAPLKI